MFCPRGRGCGPAAPHARLRKGLWGRERGKVKPSARFAIYRILRLIIAEYQQILYVEFGKWRYSAIIIPAFDDIDDPRTQDLRARVRSWQEAPFPYNFPSALVCFPAEGRRLRRFRRFVEGRIPAGRASCAATGRDYGEKEGGSQTGGGIWLRIESNCFSNSGKSFVATFQTSS